MSYIIDDCLTRSELAVLRSLTKRIPRIMNEKRRRFIEGQFEVGKHQEPSRTTLVIDKIAVIFLRALSEMEISYRKVSFDFSIDRTVTENCNNQVDDIQWHQDGMITVDGETVIPQFSMSLLISRKEGNWIGGDLMLQAGGYYVDEQGNRNDENFVAWKNSKCPIQVVETAYNRAILFRNDQGAHKVSPVVPRVKAIRDAFLISAYIHL